MSSPQPSEISERLEYFEEWLLELSTVEERKTVIDEESAKNFIKNTLDKDNSLSNLREGMDQIASTYAEFLKGDFIKDLIIENTDGVVPKLTVKPATRQSVVIRRETRLAEIIPVENKVLRRSVIERIYTPKIQEKTGYNIKINKKGTEYYTNEKTGRFVSFSTMMRFADPIVKSSPAKRSEIERLLRLEQTEE